MYVCVSICVLEYASHGACVEVRGDHVGVRESSLFLPWRSQGFYSGVPGIELLSPGFCEFKASL